MKQLLQKFNNNAYNLLKLYVVVEFPENNEINNRLFKVKQLCPTFGKFVI